jgi:hypothetical protein
VQQAFAPVVAAARTAIPAAFAGDRLHSAYLYGSVPRGTAVPGRSDLDVLLALAGEPADADRAAARRLEGELDAGFPQIDGAGILLYSAATLRYRPTSLLARETNGDLGDMLPRWRARLGEAGPAAGLRARGREAGRRLVRTGFTLVMPRFGGWTSDLEESAAVFAHYYPARAPDEGRRGGGQGAAGRPRGPRRAHR